MSLVSIELYTQLAVIEIWQLRNESETGLGCVLIIKLSAQSLIHRNFLNANKLIFIFMLKQFYIIFHHCFEFSKTRITF